MVEAATLKGIERAAVLLMALGEDCAAEVLKHMEPRELHKIGAAMVTLSNIDRTQVSTVLGEFNEQVDNQTSMGVNSQGYVRNVLVRALGRDKAMNIIESILSADKASGVDALKWMDASAIASALREEHPQVVALVLASVEPNQAAEVVGLLPEALRCEALLRVATLDSLPTKALTELNDLIEKQLMTTINAASTAKLGGPRRAAEILNQVDGGVEAPILDKIKSVNEELGQQVEEQMLVFDSLLDMQDRGIQTLLREVSSENLLVALRGADEMVRQKVMRNMSKRAAEMLQDDLETMPPVRLTDVEAAQREILMTARRLAEAGELALGGRGGDQLV